MESQQTVRATDRIVQQSLSRSARDRGSNCRTDVVRAPMPMQ